MCSARCAKEEQAVRTLVLVLVILLVVQVWLNAWLWGLVKRYQDRELAWILAETERLNKKILERL